MTPWIITWMTLLTNEMLSGILVSVDKMSLLLNSPQNEKINCNKKLFNEDCKAA